ncbi:hypothetical protein PG984_007235 [Apiospora sp. TS-2023a]
MVNAVFEDCRNETPCDFDEAYASLPTSTPFGTLFDFLQSHTDVLAVEIRAAKVQNKSTAAAGAAALEDLAKELKKTVPCPNILSGRSLTSKPIQGFPSLSSLRWSAAF